MFSEFVKLPGAITDNWYFFLNLRVSKETHVDLLPETHLGSYVRFIKRRVSSLLLVFIISRGTRGEYEDTSPCEIDFYFGHSFLLSYLGQGITRLFFYTYS